MRTILTDIPSVGTAVNVVPSIYLSGWYEKTVNVPSVDLATGQIKYHPMTFLVEHP